MVDLAGQQIGNYRMAERIASGGMADIYLARHTYLDRRVAVKILHSGISEAGQQAFLREARFIEKLKHPNIIPIYDFGIHDGEGRSFAYLVMGYASGRLAPTRYTRAIRHYSLICFSDSLSFELCAQPGHCPPRCQTVKYSGFRR